MHVSRRWFVAVFVDDRRYLYFFLFTYLIVRNCFSWFNFCSPIGMGNSGVSLSSIPVRTTLLFWSFTNTYFLRNMNYIPPSHITGIENRGLVISLKTVAFLRYGCSAYIPNSTLAIDWMFVLLANWTSIGWCYIDFTGKFGGTKCPVAVVSGYAVSRWFTISDVNCLVLLCLLLLLPE